MQNETLIIAAGCFWGVESAYESKSGIISTKVGYCGGDYPNPTYEAVCSGKTNHAEALFVVFNPEIVSYDDLLWHFWEIHDPTTLNRQGPDIGTQYRSAIFYTNNIQKEIAEKSLKQAQQNFLKPIVTQIVQLEKFWEAEEYHQQYFSKRGIAPMCHG
jgi:peptide-methionine (S)-S-oxide reductase